MTGSGTRETPRIEYKLCIIIIILNRITTCIPSSLLRYYYHTRPLLSDIFAGYDFTLWPFPTRGRILYLYIGCAEDNLNKINHLDVPPFHTQKYDLDVGYYSLELCKVYFYTHTVRAPCERSYYEFILSKANIMIV